MSVSGSEPKLGDLCPFCPNSHLKSFRINVNDHILKCENIKCLYPIAVKSKQNHRNDSFDEIFGDFQPRVEKPQIEVPSLPQIASETKTEIPATKSTFQSVATSSGTQKDSTQPKKIKSGILIRRIAKSKNLNNLDESKKPQMRPLDYVKFINGKK